MANVDNDGKTRLESWKAIARFLNVTVRTAQKWEAERRLPVERQPSRSGVIAYVEDLEEWRSSNAQSPTLSSGRRAGVLAVALVTLLSLATLVAFFLLPSSAEPVRCEWKAGQLRVLDAGGKVLWTIPAIGVDADPSGLEAGFDGSLIRDLDGDGHQEVLVNSRPAAAAPALSGVSCFERDGELRWEFHPGAKVRVAGSDVSRDYLVQRMAIPRNPTASCIVLACNHRSQPVSQVALLAAATGQLLVEYWHPGRATQILCANLDRDLTDEVIVAEVESPTPDVEAPAIVWLKLAGVLPSRVTPASVPQRWIESGYCVFPRPDVCAISARSSFQVDKLWESADGVEVELVFEIGNLFYLFDRSFNVIECRASDLLYHYHDWAFRRKMLDHRLDEQEVASLKRVRCYPARPTRPDISRAGED